MSSRPGSRSGARRPASRAGSEPAGAPGAPGAAGEDDAAVEDFLRILEEHRRACERGGKYVEAELAQQRLNELRAHEESRRREAVSARHHAENLKVEEQHMLEFQDFTRMWDARMSDFEVKAAELEGAMKGRHAAELAEMRRTAAEAPLKPKFSKDVLNLRRIQETLARQKEYAEAHKVKAKADELEAKELGRLQMQHQGRLGASEDKAVYKQQQELEALQSRVVSSRDDHRRTRQNELDKMLQRYSNVRAALDKAHKKEMAAMETHMRSALGLGRGLDTPPLGVHDDPPFDNLRIPASSATPLPSAAPKPRPRPTRPATSLASYQNPRSRASTPAAKRRPRTAAGSVGTGSLRSTMRSEA